MKSRFGYVELFCADCGSKFPESQMWYESGFKVRVCSKECHEKLSKKYASFILGKDVDVRPLKEPEP